jgi:hypothetical protein
VNKLRERWLALGEGVRSCLEVGTVVLVLALALGAYQNYDKIAALFTTETVGERLRQECTSIVMAAFPNVFDKFGDGLGPADDARKALVRQCIMERGKAW